MRWSPVAVEILLLDWLPRKVMAGQTFLAKAPDLLRAFVRFCRAERAIPSYLTDQTLDAIDRWEPEYRRAISSPRPHSTAALLAGLGAFDPDGPGDQPWYDGIDDAESWDYGSFMRTLLTSTFDLTLGSPDYLVSARRRGIIDIRDQLGEGR